MGVQHGERGYEYQKVIATRLVLDMFCDLNEEYLSVKYQAQRGENIYVDDIVVVINDGSINYCQCKQSALSKEDRKKVIKEIVQQYSQDKINEKDNKYIVYTESKDEILRDISEISKEISKKGINNIDVKSALAGKWEGFEELFKYVEVIEFKTMSFSKEPIVSLEDCDRSNIVKEKINVSDFLNILAKVDIISVDISVLKERENVYLKICNKIINYDGLCSEIKGMFGYGSRYQMDIKKTNMTELSNFKK